MSMLMTAVLTALLVAAPGASGPVPSEGQRPVPSEALLEAASEAALAQTCKVRRVASVTDCRARRGAEVRAASRRLIRTCVSEGWFDGTCNGPDGRCVDAAGAEECVALLVTAAAEGDLRSRPACGAPASCVAACAGADGGRASHRCTVRCAARAGLSGRDLIRVMDCNDGGSATGPFQIHAGVRSSCQRKLGRAVDLEDLVDAGRCYAVAVAAVADANPCGERDPWPTAMSRVAGGSWRTVRRPDGTGRREKRCGAHRYWRLGEAAAYAAPERAADGQDWPRAVLPPPVRAVVR